MKAYKCGAAVACPDCGDEIDLPVTVRLSIQTEGNEPVVLVAAEVDTDAAWAHYEKLHWTVAE